MRAESVLGFLKGQAAAPFVDTSKIATVEKRPGRRGRTFHAPGMTFVHWEFDAGADIHEHHHPQGEVWEVIEGDLEVTVGGVTAVARPGIVAIVPSDTPHAVRAIVIDHPLREG